MEQHFHVINIQQPQQEKDDVMIHNDMVLEISNNWLFVKQLIDDVLNNRKRKLDGMDSDWINFINNNNINLENFKLDNETFINNNLKNRENEQ